MSETGCTLLNQPSPITIGFGLLCWFYYDVGDEGIRILFLTKPPGDVTIETLVVPPKTTAVGALVAHISQGPKKVIQPMNINFGLFPPLEGKVSRLLRGKAYTKRALTDLKTWMVEEGLAGSGQELPS